MRLDKYLSNAGIGSRKDVKNIISSGRVTVNGTPVRDSGFHISESDDVVCDNNAVSPVFKFLFEFKVSSAHSASSVGSVGKRSTGPFSER